MTRDYKKQYEWNKENKITFSVVLSKKIDTDIIGYLEDKQKQRISRNAVIKKALRDQMLREGYQASEDGCLYSVAAEPGGIYKKIAEKEEREDLG